MGSGTKDCNLFNKHLLSTSYVFMSVSVGDFSWENSQHRYLKLFSMSTYV